MAYREEFERWMNSPKLDAALRAELDVAAADEKDLEERFYRELDFGTAGLRGIIGAGTNRMNVHVVRRATQGLADYLKAIPGAAEKGVSIAYDSRHMSDVFAAETAAVLAANGIHAYLYESLRAVPQLSFTIGHLKNIAGVVITASHNPPEYNGYKVYWDHGGQIGPEQADAVTCAIRSVDWFEEKYMPLAEAIEKGLVTMIGKEVDEAYYASTKTLLLHPELDKEKGASLNIVYTPLHGSGNIPVRHLLKEAGFVNVSVVPEQEKPDGAFPTVKAPNPEDPNAFTLAFKLADEVGASTCIATDPDSDRLGVAVRGADGKFIVLTGNQIGSLLVYYILKQKKETGTLPANGLVVRSIVSTRLADAICRDFGVELQSVLTGFRYISEKIDDCEKLGKHTFLFGFEESFGFLAGTFSRDKDAICSAMLAAEATLYYSEQGMTLYDVLREIYAKYGYYKEKVKSYTLCGKEGMEKIQNAMYQLRVDGASTFAGVKVVSLTDYMSRECKLLPAGQHVTTGLPCTDALMCELADGSWICVRPSGTEPKLKLYVGASERDEEKVDTHLENIFAEIDEMISSHLC